MTQVKSGARALRLGAVAYDPKVVTIWEGFVRWLDARGLAMEYVLFGTYEQQVEAHLAGHVDVAWNSPLAWLESERLAHARGLVARPVLMRDTDQDLTSVIVVRADEGAKGPRSIADLFGKRVAVGASDSPQATLIPLGHLLREGLNPGKDVEVVRHEVLVGKHGDHVGGERDAARALLAGRVDAACLIDGNHLAFSRDGTLPPGSTRVLAQTPTYDHCVMTALAGVQDQVVDRFVELLLGMRYDDPDARPLLDLEGLKVWRPGRTSGYALLADAIDRLGTIDAWLARMGGAPARSTR